MGRPMKPFAAASPIPMSEYPISMNMTVPIQKSIMFFMMMLPAFLARVRPVSNIAKPHCIKNTNMAPMMYHKLPAPRTAIAPVSIFLSSL